jgi:hypothetical protein
MPNEKKTLNDVKSKRKREELAGLLAEKARWTRQKKEAEDNLEAVTEILAPLMDELQVANITAPDDNGVPKCFILVHGTSSRIDKTELINHSVDPELIALCTKYTDYVSITVRSVRDDKDA